MVIIYQTKKSFEKSHITIDDVKNSNNKSKVFYEVPFIH